MADFKNATCTVSVSDYDGDSSLKQVTINFTWTPISQKGVKTQTLTTLIADPEP